MINIGLGRTLIIAWLRIRKSNDINIKMDSKRILSVQSLQRQNILKGNGFDIHSLIGKLPRPKKGWVLPGYRYCGPFNPLEEQVDENGKALLEHQPYNQVDDVCRIHDNMYSKARNKADKHKADKVMLDNLKKLKPKNFREKVDKKIVQGVIGVERKLGLGLEQEKILKDLF